MRSKKSLRTVWVLWTVLALGSAAVPSVSFKVNFDSLILKNGLRVLIVEDHSAPVAAVAVTYNVGARNDKRGQNGFAHLFEHMMFKGSENVGDGEHRAWIVNNGGTMNATTTEEHTSYYEVLPAHQLDLVLFLEADRMRSLSITQEHLDDQRRTVKEERRLRIDNQAYGRSWEIIPDTVYSNYAYKHFGLGSMEDLSAATLKDMESFFRTYYAPNNAVLTVVGDFDPQEVQTKVKKYFEPIPRQPDPPAIDIAEPEQTAPRQRVVEDPLARAPRVYIAFKTVPGNTPDFYALEVLASILAEGQSSRLYQRLVKEKELLQSVTASIRTFRVPSLFLITATPRPGKKAEDVEAAINSEIERLMKGPIADWELEKAKNLIQWAFFKNIQTALGCAQTLGSYAVLYNEPSLINKRLEKIEGVTRESVSRVASQYLSPMRASVIVFVPKSNRADTQATPPPREPADRVAH